MKQPQETKNNCWKVPIPTNLKEVFGDDDRCRLAYIELLLRCRNKDTQGVAVGDTFVDLKRGQCVCGAKELGNLFFASSKTADHRTVGRLLLRKLEKTTNRITTESTNWGTIVTVLNYDEVVSMSHQQNHQTTIRQPSDNHQTTTNKSAKSVKSAKTAESIRTRTQKYLELFNKIYDTKYTATSPIEPYLKHWLKEYSADDIKRALEAAKTHHFYKDKMTPLRLLRKHEDRIGDMLNYKQKEKKVHKFSSIKKGGAPR